MVVVGPFLNPLCCAGNVGCATGHHGFCVAERQVQGWWTCCCHEHAFDVPVGPWAFGHPAAWVPRSVP